MEWGRLAEEEHGRCAGRRRARGTPGRSQGGGAVGESGKMTDGRGVGWRGERVDGFGQDGSGLGSEGLLGREGL